MPNTDGPDARPSRVTRFEGVSHEAAQAVASLLGAPLTVEPYCESADQPVFRIDHRSEQGNITLVVWPALARVDVRCGPHTWVAKEVSATEILDDVEAIFRMDAGGLLFVTTDGSVLMVSGTASQPPPSSPHA